MSPVHPQEKIELLANYAKDNMSASQIAVLLGMSRCAVSGLAARNNIRLTGRWAGGRPKQPKPIQKQPKPVNMKCDNHMMPVLDVKPAKLLTFAELTYDSCRFPYGDRDFMYCGNQKFGDHSWCSVHCRIVFQPRNS